MKLSWWVLKQVSELQFCLRVKRGLQCSASELNGAGRFSSIPCGKAVFPLFLPPAVNTGGFEKSGFADTCAV